MLVDVFKNVRLFRHSVKDGAGGHYCHFDRSFKTAHIASVPQKLYRYISDSEQTSIVNYVGCFNLLNSVSTESTLKSRSPPLPVRYLATVSDLMSQNGAMNYAPEVGLIRISRFESWTYETKISTLMNVSVILNEEGVHVNFQGYNVTRQLYDSDAFKIRATLPPCATDFLDYE